MQKSKNYNEDKHHHKHRKQSIEDKINKNNKDYNKLYKNKKENSNVLKIKSDNVIKNEDIERINRKEHKHHHLQRNKSSSNISNKKEKEYMKYKLENFGKKKKEEIKRYKLLDIDNSIPKNLDKTNEKYYHKNKYNINSSQYDSRNKMEDKYYYEKNVENKIKNNEKDDKYKNNSNKKEKMYLNSDTKNNYNNENIIINKDISKFKGDNYYNHNKDKYKDYYNESPKINNNKETNHINSKEKEIKKSYRDSLVNNDLNQKIKKKYLKNYEHSNEKSKKILEEEYNINKDNYKKNNNKIDNEIKNEEGVYERKKDRKSSMKISSKYSEKMQSQIVEEKEKIILEQKKLEQRKAELYHMEQIKKKESSAQDNFIKTFISNLTLYIDFDKVCSRIPGDYHLLQSNLIDLDLGCIEEQFNYVYNKKNFYKSKNAKELCRKGIPIKYMKIFFKKLLNIENYKENYELKYSMTILNINPKYLGDYVPYFCGNKRKLKEVLPIHYLNEEGLTSLKLIMWLVSDLVPKMEYCPQIIKICSILLIFFEKEEAYEAMRTLIEMNYNPNDIYKLRWHFRFSNMENDKLINSISVFLENESENMKNLFEFFKNNGLEPKLLIQDFCEGLFLNYLNFVGILRFICIFIYEGTKSLYRFIYGILNYIYEQKFDELKNTKKSIITKIKELIINITDYKKIIADSFNLQISRYNNGYLKDDNGEDIEELEKPFEAPSNYNTENDNESQNDAIRKRINEKEKEKENYYIYDYYLPKIEPKSNILKTKEIIELWESLPKKMRHKDLMTIYSLSKKKINMISIIELSKKYPQNYSVLLIIETEQNELFGVILPKMLQKTEEKEYIELDNCFLVNFRPKFNLYKDNYSKGIKMLCCNKKGLWFCKQDVGDLFNIDGTLSEGRTCKDNTYFGHVNLTKKENFIIKDLEILLFIEA